MHNSKIRNQPNLNQQNLRNPRQGPLGEKFNSKMNNFNQYVCLRLFNEINMKK